MPKEIRANLEKNRKSIYDFEPYGVELPPFYQSESKILYTGQERDYYTNYDYMHFRYYASTFGRFMKPDNVTGSPMNPQNWNLYSYVHSNPVNFNDPTGHEGTDPSVAPPPTTTGSCNEQDLMINPTEEDSANDPPICAFNGGDSVLLFRGDTYVGGVVANSSGVVDLNDVAAIDGVNFQVLGGNNTEHYADPGATAALVNVTSQMAVQFPDDAKRLIQGGTRIDNTGQSIPGSTHDRTHSGGKALDFSYQDSNGNPIRGNPNAAAIADPQREIAFQKAMYAEGFNYSVVGTSLEGIVDASKYLASHNNHEHYKYTK